MHCEFRTFRGETALLRLAGTINVGADANKLRLILEAFGSGEYQEVLIEVARTTYFDPAALDILVDLIGRGGPIRMTNDTRQIREALLAKSTRAMHARATEALSRGCYAS